MLDHVGKRVQIDEKCSSNAFVRAGALIFLLLLCQGCAYFNPKGFDASEVDKSTAPPTGGYINDGRLAESLAQVLNGVVR